MNFHVQQGCVWPISMNLKIHSSKISVPLVFSSSKLTYQSTLQLLLCCHLFDYTWSVALTLQSYLQQLGRLIAVIVDVAGQGQSQLRPLHVLNLTPSWGHPIQGYTKWQLHMSGHIQRPMTCWREVLQYEEILLPQVLKSPSKVNLPSSWSLQSIS